MADKHRTDIRPNISHSIPYGIHIIGGGLAGFTTGLLLAQGGFAVHIYDPRLASDNAGNAKAKDNGLTTTMNPMAWQHLGKLGVIANLSKEAYAPIDTIAVTDGVTGGVVGKGRDAPPMKNLPNNLAKNLIDNALIAWHSKGEGSRPLAWVVNTHALLNALHSLAKQSPLITLHAGKAGCITGFAPHHKSLGTAAAMLTTETGGEIPASLVIAADGSRSRMRSLAKIKTYASSSSSPRQTALTAIVSVANPHKQTAWQVFLSGGPLALMPCYQKNVLALVWTRPSHEATRLMALSDEAFIAEVNTAGQYAFGGITQVKQRASFPLIPCYAYWPLTHRLVLVGDAAHTILPLAGQGYNLTMGDGVALVKILAEAIQAGLDIGSRAVVSRYGRLRISHTASMSLACQGLDGVFSRSPQSIRQLASLGMAVVAKTPLRRVAEWVAAGDSITAKSKLRQPF